MTSSNHDSPTDPSRREVLLSAAGALALGLGAPMTALASGARRADAAKASLTFHRGKDARPFHAVDLPDEAARVLADDGARVFAKVTIYSPERDAKVAEEIKVTYALDRVD